MLMLEQSERRVPRALTAVESALHAQVAADPLVGDWFHATTKQFSEFRFDTDRTGRTTRDWNTLLGPHFGRDRERLLEAFGYDEETFSHEGARLITVRLNLQNPFRFLDEYELERFAFQELARLEGWTLEKLARKVWRGRMALDDRLRTELVEWIDGTGWRTPRGHRNFLNDDDRRAVKVAEAVKSALVTDGYDGIVYGNLFDFPCVSAIAFAPEQIEIVDHGR